MKRRLFWKILLGFWVTFALTTEALWLIFIVLRPMPSEATRALSRISLAAATSSIRAGGEPFLHQVMDRWPVDERGRLTVQPWQAGDLLQTDINKGAISERVQSPDAKDYLVTYKVSRFAGYGHGPFDFPREIGIIAIIGGLGFSAMLAWYLTRPIIRFREGFQQLAFGDFSARLRPILGRRKDEIADLAQDFDSMAMHLEQLVAARDKLLSDVSHELRTPLARLQLAIGLARQDPARQLPALDRIGLEAKRLDELVGELLTLSKLESQVRDSEEYFDLGVVVASVVEDARFEASGNGVSITLTKNDEELLVAGSGRLIARAIENVVRNALRFSSNGQTVWISLNGNRENFDVLIEDEGPGAPPDVVPTLFEAFVRATPDGQGFGLGLAIAQRAVNAHGGTIVARNRTPNGLSVAIALPAAQMVSA